jgi:hypothetical protein
MLVRIERRSAGRSADAGPAPLAQLVELVSPRTNGANYTPIEHMFAALAREGAVSLEIAGDATARRFYARFANESTRGLLAAQIGAAYPQARVRQAAADPARLAPREQVTVCALALREAEYLPLRIARDTEIAADRAPQADPLLGVLAAVGSMPAGWRAVSQLVLQPAPTDWARRHLRRSLEHALAPERAEAARSGEGPGWGGVMLALVCLVAVVALPRLWALYLSRGWLSTALVLVPVAIGMGGLYVLWLRLSQRALYDVDLVKEKLTHPGVRVELRLAIFAPASVTAAEVQGRLAHLVAAYRSCDLERGNVDRSTSRGRAGNT